MKQRFRDQNTHIRAPYLRRGQAMVEYSMITFLLLMGSVGGGLIVFLPAMMNSLNIYLTGIYFMLSLGLP